MYRVDYNTENKPPVENSAVKEWDSDAKPSETGETTEGYYGAIDADGTVYDAKTGNGVYEETHEWISIDVTANMAMMTDVRGDWYATETSVAQGDGRVANMNIKANHPEYEPSGWKSASAGPLSKGETSDYTTVNFHLERYSSY